MAGISDLVQVGQGLGIFQFYLPFIIMFAILYGILNKSKIFGDEQQAKSINLIISLAAAAFVMVYPTTGAAIISVSDFLATLFTQTLFVAVTIIAFLVILYMLWSPTHGGSEINFQKGGTIIIAGAIILALGVYLASGGAAIFPGISLGPIGGGFYFGGIDQGSIAILAVIALTALAIIWVTRNGESGHGGKGH